MPLNDSQLLNIINTAVEDSTAQDHTFLRENEDLLDRYLGNPYGNEEPNRSKVVSNDVADVVESDLPSLVRIFLGSGEVLKFKPNKSSNKEDVEEAKQKTKYVNWQVRNQEWSYSVLTGWIKDALIQKTGVVKYFVDETTEVEEHRKKGLSPIEMTMFQDSLEGEDVESIEITERSEDDENGLMDLTFRVKKTRRQTKIVGIPTERFIFSRNSKSKNDAVVVGDLSVVRRSDLLKMGFSREKINEIPQYGSNLDVNERSRLEDIRDEDEGGSGDEAVFTDWALEEVEIQDLYVLVDYDQDGIAERRHIIRGGDVILENEVFNHVPYAMMSSILMPHKAIGRSRAEITCPTQLSKTAILRGMNDNIYAVNNPRIGANDNVVMDDLLVMRPNGIVRNKGTENPGSNMMPIEIPYIGDKALQVVQYWDSARAQTTGSLLANQGLETDNLGKETATRFKGVETASQAKVELVARTMAETGFKELFEGIAWLNANFQDSETEIEVLGEELTINPSDWKFKQSVVSSVGTGIGDNEKLLATMTGFLQIHQQLQAAGSPLTDQKKMFNILDRIVQGSGLPDVAEFYNDPEKPEQLLQAENELLQQAVQTLQQQAQQNPLAEAELIRAQAKLQEVQLREQVALQKEGNKQQLEIAKQLEDQRQFNIQAAQNAAQFQQQLAAKLAELELKFNADIPGAIQGVVGE